SPSTSTWAARATGHGAWRWPPAWSSPEVSSRTGCSGTNRRSPAVEQRHTDRAFGVAATAIPGAGVALSAPGDRGAVRADQRLPEHRADGRGGTPRRYPHDLP